MRDDIASHLPNPEHKWFGVFASSSCILAVSILSISQSMQVQTTVLMGLAPHHSSFVKRFGGYPQQGGWSTLHVHLPYTMW